MIPSNTWFMCMCSLRRFPESMVALCAQDSHSSTPRVAPLLPPHTPRTHLFPAIGDLKLFLRELLVSDDFLLSRFALKGRLSVGWLNEPSPETPDCALLPSACCFEVRHAPAGGLLAAGGVPLAEARSLSWLFICAINPDGSCIGEERTLPLLGRPLLPTAGGPVIGLAAGCLPVLDGT